MIGIAILSHAATKEDGENLPERLRKDGLGPSGSNDNDAVLRIGNGRFGHPEQDRGLSLREGALQGFPSGYAFRAEWRETIFKKKIGRLIGNAVPVRLGRIIGKSILRHVEEAATSPRSGG